jgi:hypothetical protein
MTVGTAVPSEHTGESRNHTCSELQKLGIIDDQHTVSGRATELSDAQAFAYMVGRALITNGESVRIVRSLMPSLQEMVELTPSYVVWSDHLLFSCFDEATVLDMIKRDSIAVIVPCAPLYRALERR